VDVTSSPAGYGGESGGRHWRGTDWEGQGGRQDQYGYGGREDAEYGYGYDDGQDYDFGGAQRSSQFRSSQGGSGRSSQDYFRQSEGGRWGGERQGQHSGKGPKGYQRSDERIREDVSEALSQHGDVDASEIEVEVRNGEVTLSGTVSEREAKRFAEEAAENCAGVKDVQNRIRVQQQGQQSQSGQGGMSSQRSQSGSTSQGSYGSGSGDKDRDSESKSKSRSTVGSAG
jgi:hypothetical protein